MMKSNEDSIKQRQCSVEGCDRKHHGRGFCSAHCKQFAKYGYVKSIEIQRIHGLSNSPEYISWTNMKKRCSSNTPHTYYRYKKRGIKVCDRWKNSFTAFYEDMGKRPSLRHSIDRIDNDGNYCPENCRWATWEEQARNRSSNHYITYNGQKKSLAEWCEIFELSYTAVHQRLVSGWSVHKAFNTPVSS